MDKYIGFDIDSKKTIVCVAQKGKKKLATEGTEKKIKTGLTG